MAVPVNQMLEQVSPPPGSPPADLVVMVMTMVTVVAVKVVSAVLVMVGGLRSC